MGNVVSSIPLQLYYNLPLCYCRFLLLDKTVFRFVTILKDETITKLEKINLRLKIFIIDRYAFIIKYAII